MRNKIKGVIFDMDGVLVDSEPLITHASMQALEEYNIHGAQYEDFTPFRGMGDDKFIGGVAEKYGGKYDIRMKERAYEIYLELCGTELEVFKGGRALVEKVWENGYFVAIASASDSVKVEANIKRIGVPREYYDVVLTGSDVAKKKPDPEIYIKTAEKMGLSPENCVVIEDAVAGVEAAKSAGMRCVAVTTSFAANLLTVAGADAVVDDVFDAGDYIELWNS